MNSGPPVLIQIHQEIDRRASSISGQAGDWPCQKGCDYCCRHLADVPRATAAEWELVFAAVTRLNPQVQAVIHERIEELTDARPVICPFLDRNAGACLVYDSRPIACRAYGFYVERAEGLYCNEILKRVESGQYAGVVWGNHASLKPAQSALGPLRALTGDDAAGGENISAPETAASSI